MKQTIDINGITLVIEQTEDAVSVKIEKDGEIVEEMTHEFVDGDESQAQIQGDEQPDFGDEDLDADDAQAGDEIEEEIQDDVQFESYSAFLERMKSVKK